ncbi:MAG: polyprenyl synthetase family protein [Armatimonadetes bacterium]|nr:polyprenyl synthetase family protein [Armatimonadota bacterium]
MVVAALRSIEDDLHRVEALLQELLERRAGFLKHPAGTMFRSGGKRLRPALVLLAQRLFGPSHPGAVSLAAAIEMIHGASLLHDDVLDETTVRRGQPTLNASLGNRFSVLLGDFLLCQALLAVADLDRVVLLQVISQAVADMTSGQILELTHQGNLDTSVENYMEIVGGKTASLMVAGCKLGALLGEASAEDVERIGRFGYNVGMAFQIVDDVLDFWGEPSVLGKPTGSDLREKKYTLPFIDAYQRAEPQERERVHRLLSNGTLEGGGLDEVVRFMEKHDTRRRSLEVAEDYVRIAGEELARVPPCPDRECLRELLSYVTARDR